MSECGQQTVLALQQKGLPMSAFGHKQTFALRNAMSALPPKADICGAQTMSASANSGRRDNFRQTVNRPTYRTDDAVCGQ